MQAGNRTVAGQHRNQAHFSRIPSAEIARSSFDRSHGLKTTLDSGFLVPVLVDELLPGDTLKCSVNSFARMATPLHPIMDNQFLEFFFFAVPLRILWDNFEKFMGAQDNPGDSTDFLVPQVTTADAQAVTGSIGDYFGLPIGIEHTVAAFHHRAYNLIYKEWFRSEDLQDSPVILTDDTTHFAIDYPLRRRGKRHDYFTSCLPFPQKSENPVELPIGDTAPVVSTFDDPLFILSNNSQPGQPLRQGTGSEATGVYIDDTVNAGGTLFYGNTTGLEADLSSATAITINQIREAFQLQKLFERDARGGTRYTEQVRSHWQIISPDARLQRPEYLGGGLVNINVNPIANTAGNELTPDDNLGSLAAYVTAAGQTRGFIYSATEHCVVLGLCSIRADLNYQQNINRMWNRKTRFDYFWPVFSMIGEQAVLSRELYYDGDTDPNTGDDSVFGYQEAWAEYRYKPSLITGEFRSLAAQSLDTWHLAQDFAQRPLLNDEFIQENPPTQRVIAVQDEPTWLLDLWFTYHHTRAMPTYSVPGLIDHF